MKLSHAGGGSPACRECDFVKRGAKRTTKKKSKINEHVIAACHMMCELFLYRSSV